MSNSDSQNNGHRQRLRKRYMNEGLDNFAPHESLELLLTFAIPRRDVKPIAKALISEFGTISGVFEASIDQLKVVDGIGATSACLIRLVLDLGKSFRLAKESPKLVYNDVEQIARHCIDLHFGATVEQLYLICLDNKKRMINNYLISRGTCNNVEMYLPTIIEKVLISKAKFCVITHNHPYGIVAPSEPDIRLTFKVMNALKSVEVQLIDHVIVNDAFEWSSMRKANII